MKGGEGKRGQKLSDASSRASKAKTSDAAKGTTADDITRPAGCITDPPLCTTILRAWKGRINKDAEGGGSFNEEGRGRARGFTGVALHARIRVAGKIRAAGSVPMFGIGGKDK